MIKKAKRLFSQLLHLLNKPIKELRIGIMAFMVLVALIAYGQEQEVR